MKRAVYPGTFDPPTKGHEDIAIRALEIFDEVIIAVGDNSAKNVLFSTEERISLWQQIFSNEPRVKIISFSGLLVDTVRKLEANIIVRGLRAISDFEYELQIASINKDLDQEIDTVFFTARGRHLFLSSTMAKEIARHNGKSLAQMVSLPIQKALLQKFNH